MKFFKHKDLEPVWECNCTHPYEDWTKDVVKDGNIIYSNSPTEGYNGRFPYLVQMNYPDSHKYFSSKDHQYICRWCNRYKWRIIPNPSYKGVDSR